MFAGKGWWCKFLDLRQPHLHPPSGKPRSYTDLPVPSRENIRILKKHATPTVSYYSVNHCQSSIYKKANTHFKHGRYVFAGLAPCRCEVHHHQFVSSSLQLLSEVILKNKNKQKTLKDCSLTVMQLLNQRTKSKTGLPRATFKHFNV